MLWALNSTGTTYNLEILSQQPLQVATSTHILMYLEEAEKPITNSEDSEKIELSGVSTPLLISTQDETTLQNIPLSTTGNPAFSNSSIHTYATIAKSFLRWLFKVGYISEDITIDLPGLESSPMLGKQKIDVQGTSVEQKVDISLKSCYTYYVKGSCANNSPTAPFKTVTSFN